MTERNKGDVFVSQCPICDTDIEQTAGHRRKETCGSKTCVKSNRQGKKPYEPKPVVAAMSSYSPAVPPEVAEELRLARFRQTRTLNRLRLVIDDQDPDAVDFERVGRAAWEALSGVTYDDLLDFEELL